MPDQTDDFGFYVGEKSEDYELDKETEARREEKWSEMLDKWEKTKKDRMTKVKERVRKGVPATMRGRVWALLTGGKELADSNPGRYVALQKMNDTIPQEIRDIITRDLHRTLPNHSLFRDESAGGQQILKRILNAYAAHDPTVGYVQGMGFIASMLLVTKMTEETAFWTFVAIMTNPTFHMQQLYLPGFPELKKMQFQLDKLTEKFLPKLHAHFKSQDVDASHSASQWFLTLYVYQFPDHPYLLMRILDTFIMEGWKVMFRVALCLFKLEQENLLKMGMEEIYPHLKNLQNNKAPDYFMHEMLRLSLKTEHLQKYGKEYDSKDIEMT